MSSAWLLPEHIADVLPAQARRVEDLRRLLLDRARLSAARVRERLQQAIGWAGNGANVDRLAVAWVDGAMIWQFDASSAGKRLLIYLDEAGKVITPPEQFPVSVHEREQGFAATRPALPFVSEVANP